MQTSKLTRLFWTIFLCLITSFLSQAGTEQNDEQTVFYIGFNDFPQKHLTKSQAQFDDYIRQLRPVMDKYKMHLWVYDVTFGGSDALQADVITFGSAPNMDVMQSFFQDPELQAIFPMLVEALNEHQVIFTNNPVIPPEDLEGHTLLALNWLDSHKPDASKSLDRIEQSLLVLQKQYGVKALASATGVMSNRGLAADVVSTNAPQQIQLWQLKDAHGYLEHPKVKAVNKEAKNYLIRLEDFWIKPRQ